MVLKIVVIHRLILELLPIQPCTQVLSEMRGAALEKGPVAPVHPQRSNSTATTIPATEEELAALGRKARLTFAWSQNRFHE